MLGLDLADFAATPPTWHAHLWREYRLVAVAPMQDLGSFVFADLVPTEYELNIIGPNLAINIASIRVA